MGFFTNKLREDMPLNFSYLFRAREMLEHIPHDPVKDYRQRGYDPLDISKFLDRFEEQDEIPSNPYENKAEAKIR